MIQLVKQAPTSNSTVSMFGLSIRVLAKLPGEVLNVNMMLFFGFDAHCTNRSLEKPQFMSAALAKTTFIATTSEILIFKETGTN